MNRTALSASAAALCALLVAACSSPQAPTPVHRSPHPLERPIAGPFIPSGDERSVYEAALARVLVDWRDEDLETSAVFVLHRTTAVLWSPSKVPADSVWSLSDREAWADFVERNRERYSIEGGLSLAPHMLIPPLAIANLFETGPWDVLAERFPKARGFLILSRVGFSASADAAVVEVGTFLGPQDGVGVRFVLRRGSGKWRVEQESMTWIS